MDFDFKSHAARFIEKVDIPADPDACMLWTGAVDKNGYGVFWITEPGHKHRGYTVKAHRFSYGLAYGHWPKPEACHHCDVEACQNPRHLYEGTRSDNMQDRAERGQQAGGRSAQ
jgi:hypothetical protein